MTIYSDAESSSFSVFLHLCLQALPVALRKLGPTTNPEVSLPWDAVRDALDYMAQAAASYVDREHFLVLWESLQVRIEHAEQYFQLLRTLMSVFFILRQMPFDGGVSPHTGQCSGGP